ncbi:hypothetical protein M011DRAFT_234530 [Sporormia fimetaria CBS 119925]|uniref:Uncharacterized protein n=1 Tax=Sporormia fimetaria CBS 119925 TaxID=1340428 RepID=A0A6A6VM60_9PLEO|nr:hypothetical protein M011DRAFT_234530 [Sporormia fimetaria CBS 119925]
MCGITSAQPPRRRRPKIGVVDPADGPLSQGPALVTLTRYPHRDWHHCPVCPVRAPRSGSQASREKCDIPFPSSPDHRPSSAVSDSCAALLLRPCPLSVNLPCFTPDQTLFSYPIHTLVTPCTSCAAFLYQASCVALGFHHRFSSAVPPTTLSASAPRVTRHLIHRPGTSAELLPTTASSICVLPSSKPTAFRLKEPSSICSPPSTTSPKSSFMS